MIDKLHSYIWKNKKKFVDKNTTNQDEIKLLDMTEYQLRESYQHCKNMLFNDSKNDPGRYLVLEEISQQINNCSAELSIRWFCQLIDDHGNPKYSRFSLLNEVTTLIENIKSQYEEDHVFKLQDLYSNIPVDFKPVSIESIIKGCKDTLGKFNRKRLTKAFIIRQGIWFTP